jgi:GTP cyclohydrolase IA
MKAKNSKSGLNTDPSTRKKVERKIGTPIPSLSVNEDFLDDLEGELLQREKDPLELSGELILRTVGEDLAREGIQRTPYRFAKAMREVCVGYTMTVEDAVGEGVFAAEGKGLVSVKDVEFYSLCEHHMLPFFGKVSVAYYPNEKILGLSKIPRIVGVFSKRFQVQERLTRQIAEAVQKCIEPRAVLVKVSAAHLCMQMRGVETQNSHTVTESSLGIDWLSVEERNRLFHSIG